MILIVLEVSGVRKSNSNGSNISNGIIKIVSITKVHVEVIEIVFGVPVESIMELVIVVF